MEERGQRVEEEEAASVEGNGRERRKKVRYESHKYSEMSCSSTKLDARVREEPRNAPGERETVLGALEPEVKVGRFKLPERPNVEVELDGVLKQLLQSSKVRAEGERAKEEGGGEEGR